MREGETRGEGREAREAGKAGKLLSIGKSCGYCGGLIERGTGYHNAVLCVGCWADIMARIEGGEAQVALAGEYGVSQPAIHFKLLRWGSRENRSEGHSA